eukprot:3532251-Heterocapsa_arctica.AAC.1
MPDRRTLRRMCRPSLPRTSSMLLPRATRSSYGCSARRPCTFASASALWPARSRWSTSADHF